LGEHNPACGAGKLKRGEDRSSPKEKEMKRWTRAVVVIVVGAVTGTLFTGCYTLFNKNEKNRPVTFQSQEPGIEFELYKGDTIVATGKTPYVVDMGARFFNGAYTLKFKDTDGTEKTQKVAGKVTVSAADVVFLALDTIAVPFVVIDLISASGKLWTMPAVVNLQTGGAVSYNTTGGEGQLTLLSIDDVPSEMRSQLVPLEEGVDYRVVKQEAVY
jgi:hypothetical protein